MTTLRDAAKQTIGLLEAELMRRPEQKIYAAITVLRQALEAEQQAEPVACKHEWFRTGAMNPCECRCIKCGKWGDTHQPPARPELRPLTQEQIDAANALKAEPVGTLSIEVYGPRTKIDFEWSDRLRELPAGNHKLYLYPQQPLTDEQIDAEHDKLFPAPVIPGDRAKVRSFARAIERAYGTGGSA